MSNFTAIIGVRLWGGIRGALLAAALLVPLALAFGLAQFSQTFSSTDGALILGVVVVALAAIGQRILGSLAAVSAACWFNFFLARPRYHFEFSGRDRIQTTLLLLLGASWSASWLCAPGASGERWRRPGSK